jgi:hypothetical protein
MLDCWRDETKQTSDEIENIQLSVAFYKKYGFNIIIILRNSMRD